jgi:DNA-binding SARP family transcriptional activator/ABC-type glycerol-3-phosphate transport system substrate-binding protein
MQFRVLGPLEVAVDAGKISLGGPKQRAVLAGLLIRPNQMVPAEDLIDQVWGEDPPNTARKTLQSYVTHLRQALGSDRLEWRTPGYLLHVGSRELDAARFESLLHEAKATNARPDRAAALYRRAIGQWRGPAFADLASDGALAAEAHRLNELRLEAVEGRIAADLDAGRHNELIPELAALTGEHPLRERLWGQLMVALYRSGRQADASSAYHRACQVLAEELGMDPSEELRGLHDRILRNDQMLQTPHERLRGYELVEEIGEGGFGLVYRAWQPQLAREVAIKAIRPALANDPEFIRRFEAEAQVVARLEHANIVPLYDYWRQPGAAYLVLRWIRGGSLEETSRRAPFDLETVARLEEQIASALSFAHRLGVIHSDLKPANVLLDDEANAYLSDFGIAADLRGLQADERDLRLSPAHLSPEQIRGEPATSATDIYCLGLLLFQVLCGAHPFSGTPPVILLQKQLHEPLPPVTSRRPELAGVIDDVISRATAKDPEARFPDVAAFDLAFREALQTGRARIALAPEVELANPYKGLRPFVEADALDFFGRDTLVDRILVRLGETVEGNRFLGVVGPSGSGKSSAIRAGLIPALRAGALPRSDSWFILEMVPGAHPFEELEGALLRIATDPSPTLVDQLREDHGLLDAVERVLPPDGSELFLMIDQLEELFTHVEEEETTARFLACLASAATDPRSRIRVLVTLRADFFDRPLAYSAFGPLLGSRTETVTPLTPAELELAIAGPAQRIGVSLEPELLAEVLADSTGRLGALPLLQYALTELFERRKNGALTLSGYRQVGGIGGALAGRAEHLYEATGRDEGKEAARQLFLRLVNVDEGVEDLRRRVRRYELLSIEVNPKAMAAAIDAFTHHRLLISDRDPLTREPTVEVAHEALLRSWPRLRGWIDSSREDLRQRARISSATGEWIQAERSSGYLMSGIRLAQAEATIREESIRLTEAEREYLDASIARRDAEAAAERIRHARELSLERRSRSRLRGLVVVLAAALLVAASLTVVAANRSREAQRRSDEATVLGLTGAALSNLRSDPELSLQLALQAVNLSSELGEQVPTETVEALHWAIQESGVQYPVQTGPVATLPSPLGFRGVFDLPVSALANYALRFADHTVPARVCGRFFDSSRCPSLPDRFEPGIASAPLRTTPGDQPLAGTIVTFMGIPDDGGMDPFIRELQGFGEQTGIDIRISPPDFDKLTKDPADIAFVSQPGWIETLEQQGHLMNLSGYLDIDQLEEDYGTYLLSLETVAPDGSWPAEHGNLRGLPLALSLKSLVWYPVPEFQRAGYTVPETWNELVALTDRMVADGRTPWCMGLESGSASGWPATDWIENLVLGEAGPRAYDRWVFHRIPFDDRVVRRAFERFGEIVFGDRNLALGPHGAVASEWTLAQLPMVESDPPQCWLYHFPSFASTTLTDGSIGRTTDAFPFPTPSPAFRDAVVGGMGMALVFADRPEVREVVRFLASPEFGREWFTAGDGNLSANGRFDASTYDPPWRRLSHVLDTALAEDTFRVDGGDLMPPEVGAFGFWDAMIRYLEQGPDSLDAILAELEAAWPDDG